MKQIVITFFIMFCTSLTLQAQTASDYQAAAENGDAEAQYKLGDCYDKAKGVTRDYEKAAYWFAKAAEQ